MDQVMFREEGCALCVFRGHICDRPPDGPCRTCRNGIIYHINGIQQKILRADRLDLEAVRCEIHQGRLPGALISLDARGGNTNSLHVYVRSSTGQPLDFYLPFIVVGDFSTSNLGIRKLFDSYIRHLFSADLKAVEANFPMIPDVMTACGYIAILCSVTEVTETSYTWRNGIPVENPWQNSNLRALFMDFCVCRLHELIEKVMDAARTVVGNDNQPYCANAYTAIAILYNELKYFEEKLEHGHLRTLVPETLKRHLVNWFRSLIDELVQRLREDCGRYEYWTLAIKGRLESLRRRVETYKVHLCLQRYEWTDGTSLLPAPNLPPPSPPQVALETSVATLHAAPAITPIIVGADGRSSYVGSSPRYYNPATGQAGPSTSLLDTRYDSYYGHYSGQYPF